MRNRGKVESAGFLRNCLIIPSITKSAFLRKIHKNAVKICKMQLRFSCFLGKNHPFFKKTVRKIITLLYKNRIFCVHFRSGGFVFFYGFLSFMSRDFRDFKDIFSKDFGI